MFLFYQTYYYLEPLSFYIKPSLVSSSPYHSLMRVNKMRSFVQNILVTQLNGSLYNNITTLLHMLHYMNVAAAYLMNPFVNKIVTYSLASNNKEKTWIDTKLIDHIWTLLMRRPKRMSKNNAILTRIYWLFCLPHIWMNALYIHWKLFPHISVCVPN